MGTDTHTHTLKQLGNHRYQHGFTLFLHHFKLSFDSILSLLSLSLTLSSVSYLHGELLHLSLQQCGLFLRLQIKTFIDLNFFWLFSKPSCFSSFSPPDLSNGCHSLKTASVCKLFCCEWALNGCMWLTLLKSHWKNTFYHDREVRAKTLVEKWKWYDRTERLSFTHLKHYFIKMSCWKLHLYFSYEDLKAAIYNAYIKSINIIFIVCKCTLYKNKYERNFIST